MPKPGTRPIVFVVDDDDDVREGLRALLNSLDMRCEVFRSTREFLQHKMPEEPSCLILDVRLPGASGLELQHELADTQIKNSYHLYFRSRRYSDDGEGDECWCCRVFYEASS